MRTMPKGAARAMSLLALAGCLVVLAGCGAAAATTSTGGGTGAAATPTAATSSAHGAPAAGAKRRFRANPAIRAASEIIQVAPVVPFSAQQVKTLVPMLQALAKDPKLSASALAAKAKALTAVLTTQQTQALRNMLKSHFTTTGPFFAGGARGRRRPAGGAAHPPKGARHFNPASIYRRAIAVLQRKATGGFGAPGASSTTAGA